MRLRDLHDTSRTRLRYVGDTGSGTYATPGPVPLVVLDGLALWTISSATEEDAVLVELGLMEQRYKAVLEVLDGAVSVTDVARRYGVGRQTVHTWLRRYATEGWAAGAGRPQFPSRLLSAPDGAGR